MFYDKKEEAMVVESLDGSEMWVEVSGGYSLGDSAGTVYLNHRGADEQETAEAFSPAEAMQLSIELARAAGGAPEPHVWEVYVNILDDRRRSKFFKQISLHATKAGAEQKVEDEKKAWPDDMSDPNFILAARKLRIGA